MVAAAASSSLGCGHAPVPLDAQPLSPVGLCEEATAHQNLLLTIPGVTEDFVEQLDMTEEEQTHIPFPS